MHFAALPCDFRHLAQSCDLLTIQYFFPSFLSSFLHPSHDQPNHPDAQILGQTPKPLKIATRLNLQSANMSSMPPSQLPSAKHNGPSKDGQEAGTIAPSDPSVESPVTDQGNILAEKQERVRRVLWHCLKSPPQVEVKVGPGELRVAAKFNVGDVGVHFEDVKTEAGQIVVAAQLDPLNVEVNFEQLSALAGLESVEKQFMSGKLLKSKLALHHLLWILKVGPVLIHVKAVYHKARRANKFYQAL